MTSNTHDRLRVVIAGGGVAALETLLALRTLAGELVELTLICGEREFLYRPVTVAEAFTAARRGPTGWLRSSKATAARH